jgi:hypothetical protein
MRTQLLALVQYVTLRFQSHEKLAYMPQVFSFVGLDDMYWPLSFAMDLVHCPHLLCAVLIARTGLRDAAEIADFLPRFPADKPDDDGIALARAESDTEPGTLLSLIGGPARIHHVIFIPDESVSEDDDISECDTGRYPKGA